MIELVRLDLGYDQCVELFTLVQESGGKNLENLEINCTNLISHWHGSDATLHINNLIAINNSLITFFDETLNIMTEVAGSIVDIQEVRSLNGGSKNVGSRLQKNFSYQVLKEIETTEEYTYDPELENDFVLLSQICTDFDSFRNSFGQISEELMQNWTSGHNRDIVKRNFDEFMELSNQYKKLLSEAKSGLEISKTNLAQLK